MAHKRTIDMETLLLIKRQFPTHPWADQEVRKLLDSEHGVITDFREILADVERLMLEDLGATPPMSCGRPSHVRLEE